MSARLEFVDVWKSYGFRVPVLRGVSFSLSVGEIALLIGENGAGKTTILEIACSNIRADRGSVRVGDVTLNGRAPEEIARRGVRRMYQSPAVFQSLSIRDNVLLAVQPGLYQRFLPWGFDGLRKGLWRSVRAMAPLLFEASPFLDHEMTLTSELSFGQKQIVDFLAAVASPRDSSLLLLDEPFAGIHADVVEIMWQMIRDLSAAGAAVLLIEHEIEQRRYEMIRRLQLKSDGTLQ